MANLTDLFVDALSSMQTPSYAQERHTRAPIVYEKNALTPRDVVPGVSVGNVIAYQDPTARMFTRILQSKYGGVHVPSGVISVDPTRAAADIESNSSQPESLSTLIRHEATHQVLSGVKNLKAPSGKDVPSWGVIQGLIKNTPFEKEVGDLDEELPAYVAQQPWRVPGMTPELRNQFLDEYSNHIAKYDPAAAKTYRALAPEMTAAPIQKTTAVVGVPTIANNEDQQ